MKGLILLVGTALLMTMLPAPASADVVALEDVHPMAIYDENGDLIYEIVPESSNPLLMKMVHHLRVGAVAKDESGGNGNGKGGGGGGSGTDCASTAYKTNGYYWNEPYSAYSTGYASIVSSTLSEWDDATAASVSGGASSGSKGEAGTYDGVNQLDWVNLGESTTIAVTTTWYYRGSGIAVESDGEYNTYYPWSTNGDPDAMDVENIVQHETGHTYGLGHPRGGGAECLTMYAYADYGETQKRTLGDGDILGMKAIYGN